MYARQFVPLIHLFIFLRHALSSDSYEKLKGVNICFYSNTAGDRGTEVALYQYADYAESMFRMNSRIIFPKLLETSNLLSDRITEEASQVGVGGPGCRASLSKFKSRFNVSFCGESFSDSLYKYAIDKYGDYDIPYFPICSNLSTEAREQFRCDLLYIIKGGLFSHPPQYPAAFGGLPTIVHSVFNWEPHGTVYGAVSPYIKSYRPRDKGNVVPHMVDPPHPDTVASSHSYRNHFNISDQAVVVCRHGSDNSFDIDYVKRAIVELLLKFDAEKLHFVFLDTDSFRRELIDIAAATASPVHALQAARKQVHFIPSTTDHSRKENFFKTCDCMLHARKEGETFGLSVAEFSIRNKPVITQEPRNRYADFHVRALGEKGIYYRDQATVVSQISALVTNGIPKDIDYNGYREYLPEKVMETFKALFLDPVILLIGKTDLNKLPTMW